MVSTNIIVAVVLMVYAAPENVAFDLSSKDADIDHNLIPKFFKSLDEAFKYFEKEFKIVNLDAIFGLRISQGVLENILTSMDKTLSRNDVPLFLRYYITNLRNRARKVILRSLPFLKSADENYFRNVGFTVENKWTFVQPFKRLNIEGNGSASDRQVPQHMGSAYQPCMVALVGSGGPGYEPCNVTDRCWQVMTRLDNVGYSLTHQALYFMFGKQIGCSSVLSAKLKQSHIQGGYQTLFQNICTSMYHQMEILENLETKTHAQTDLYLEQAVICGGLLGYTNFLTLGRLDGCESHITGVATALLSSYLRWLVLQDMLSPPKSDFITLTF